MRISDWSSDVCSSDLLVWLAPVAGALCGRKEMAHDHTTRPDRARFRTGQHAGAHPLPRMAWVVLGTFLQPPEGFHPGLHDRTGQIGRASCREECVSTCRSRW